LFTRTYPHDPALPRLLPLAERTAAPAGLRGRGVTIAFIDSGFSAHPDIAERVLVHADATMPQVIEGGRYGTRPEWFAWHGTMTSVIAAGDGRTSGGTYRGLASEARLVLVKVSTLRRQIKEDDILRGLQWLIVHGARFGVRVVNISVGGDVPDRSPTHPLHVAVRALTAQGMTVVIAAGNSGASVLLPPASAAEAVVVGGYDDVNTADRARWQPYPGNTGAATDGSRKPDVLGPARWLPSPILPGSLVEREARWLVPLFEAADVTPDTLIARIRPGFTDLRVTAAQARQPALLAEYLRERILEHKLVDLRHQYVEGTSVSAAVVSGVVAQMLEARPDATPAAIAGALRASAHRPPGSPADGAGWLNPSGAIAALQPEPDAASA
jgi:serine protease AprX